MSDIGRKLNHELEVWSNWSTDASRGEQGWQSDAPNWNGLMNCAKRLLLSNRLEPGELADLEVVFEMSEEGEHLADYLRSQLPSVSRDTILMLSMSNRPAVRWQIYDTLSGADQWQIDLLLQGTRDHDPYVRRRAFLRLASVAPLPPLSEVLERFWNDTDQLNREIAQKAFPPEERMTRCINLSGDL